MKKAETCKLSQNPSKASNPVLQFHQPQTSIIQKTAHCLQIQLVQAWVIKIHIEQRIYLKLQQKLAFTWQIAQAVLRQMTNHRKAHLPLQPSQCCPERNKVKKTTTCSLTLEPCQVCHLVPVEQRLLRLSQVSGTYSSPSFYLIF